MFYVRKFRVFVSEVLWFEIQADEVHQLEDRVVFLKNETVGDGELTNAVFFNSSIIGWQETPNDR